MPKKNDLPLEKIQVRFVEGDKEIISRFYPAPIGFNAVVRTLTHRLAKSLVEKEAATIGNVAPVLGTLDIEEILAEAAEASDVG